MVVDVYLSLLVGTHSQTVHAFISLFFIYFTVFSFKSLFGLGF